MDLKSVLTGKETLEFYWALVFEPGWVQAGIWSIQEGKANVVSIGPAAAWETEAELTTAADTALSAAIQNLPEDAPEPTKTVFGVSSAWVEEGQIKAEMLDKIKKICSDLSLTPVGFVVISEAIAYYIKSDEGAPLNAIVIGVGGENIEISVFKLGNFSGTQLVSRSVSVANDVAEGLSRFASVESLPSRILIYDGKEGQLDEVRQALMDTNWEDYEKIKFLHTPKIEILIPDKKVMAVALAGGAEIASVTKVQQPEQSQVIEHFETDQKAELAKESQPEETPAKVALASPELKPIAEPELADLGFVKNQDIGQQRQSVPQPAVLTPAPAGFQPDEGKRQFAGLLPSLRAKFARVFSQLSGRINGFLEKFGTSGYSEGRSKKFASPRILIIGISALIIIFLAGFVFWWYVPTATVTIYISPQKLEQSETITIDPQASGVNFDKLILAGEPVSQTASGDKTRSTSGTKTVGEKAKGEVTLYRSGSEITLDAGTKLSGPGGLGFTLDNETTIASGSASSPGTTQAVVTAADIGAQYNLAGGATFSVSNYPRGEIEAKNESAFSGGTSRDISAVSESDQENLLEDLQTELTDKAVEEITAKIPEDRIFIPETVTTTITDETFGNKVGDEASTLKLSLAIKVEGLTVAKADLVELANNVLKSKVAQGYVLRGDQIDFAFELEEAEDDVFQVKTSYQANLLPEINTDKIQKDIAGKFPTLANSYLSSIPGFSRASFTIKPRLPGRLGTLPRQAKNISIEVASD